jgi:hypothetical protein
MLHRIGKFKGLLSPFIKSSDGSEVGMSVTWGVELEQKLFYVLLSSLICVDLGEELTQFNPVET